MVLTTWGFWISLSGVQLNTHSCIKVHLQGVSGKDGCFLCVLALDHIHLRQDIGAGTINQHLFSMPHLSLFRRLPMQAKVYECIHTHNRDMITVKETSTKIKPHDSVRCHGVSVEIQVCAIVSLRQGVKVLSHFNLMCENKWICNFQQLCETASVFLPSPSPLTGTWCVLNAVGVDLRPQWLCYVWFLS